MLGRDQIIRRSDDSRCRECFHSIGPVFLDVDVSRKYAMMIHAQQGEIEATGKAPGEGGSKADCFLFDWLVGPEDYPGGALVSNVLCWEAGWPCQDAVVDQTLGSGDHDNLAHLGGCCLCVWLRRRCAGKSKMRLGHDRPAGGRV